MPVIILIHRLLYPLVGSLLFELEKHCPLKPFKNFKFLRFHLENGFCCEKLFSHKIDCFLAYTRLEKRLGVFPSSREGDFMVWCLQLGGKEFVYKRCYKTEGYYLHSVDFLELEICRSTQTELWHTLERIENNERYGEIKVVRQPFQISIFACDPKSLLEAGRIISRKTL